MGVGCGAAQLLGLDAERHLPGIVAAVDPAGEIRSAAPFAGAGGGSTDDRAFCHAVATQKAVRLRLIAELSARFRLKTTAEWEVILRDHGVWHHTVSNVNDVINDAQANAVGAFADIGAQFPVLCHPIKWSAAEAPPRGRAPSLGQDTEAVLQGLQGLAKL
jgi:crotonobetainyl-CoA:carnitine CoA-transferase CaiB-like acyl-CoA transferase